MTKINPILTAIAGFIAFAALYFGGMALLDATGIISFKEALEPFRVIVTLVACCFGARSIQRLTVQTSEC